MGNKNLIAEIKSYFADKPEIAAVYLYGSFARGEEKNDSDVDLAVLFNDSSVDNLSLRFTYEDELGNLLAKKAEIQELNIVGVEFAKRVLDEGRLIVDKDTPSRITYEIKIINNYFDMLPFYEEYYEVLKRQSLKGDFHA